MVCRDDSSFGPAVQGCRDDFDFTVTFEKIIFSIIPASVFVILAAVRVGLLARRARVVGAVAFQFVKLVSLSVGRTAKCSALVILPR